MHIFSPETDNCPSWISGRERMTVENISWSISTKECCRPRRGLNPRPPGLQSDGTSKWATEAGTVQSTMSSVSNEIPKTLRIRSYWTGHFVWLKSDCILKNILANREGPDQTVLMTWAFAVRIWHKGSFPTSKSDARMTDLSRTGSRCLWRAF